MTFSRIFTLSFALVSLSTSVAFSMGGSKIEKLQTHVMEQRIAANKIRELNLELRKSIDAIIEDIKSGKEYSFDASMRRSDLMMNISNLFMENLAIISDHEEEIRRLERDIRDLGGKITR